MSDLSLSVTQYPDHVVELGETIVHEGTPYLIKAIKPQRESGVFLDFGRNVHPNVVIVEIERFDGYPA